MMPDTELGFAAYFSPDDDVQVTILTHARTASKSLDMSMYGFHLPPLRDLFIEKHGQGVAVRLLLDHSQEAGRAEKPDVDALVAAGIDVAIGTSPKHAILHSKYLVVDGLVVLTGSYNFSLSAAKQDNTLHVLRWPDLAAKYTAHFERARAWVRANEPTMQPKAVAQGA